jgi:hypothetical protein
MTKRVIVKFVTINVNACAAPKNRRHRSLTKKEEATNERKRAKKSNRGYCLCGSELLE